MDFKDKVVLVTGSSRGLGKSTVLEYAKRGACVIINYNKSKSKALELEEYIKTNYKVDTMCIKCDVSNEEEVSSMIDKIIGKFGHIDIVVNNAAIAMDSDIIDKNKETWRRVLDVNLIGTFLVSKYASKYINNGSIVNVSSTNGIDTNYVYSMEYDASKASVISLTKNMALLYGPNIRVNCVCPGWIDTDMNKDLDSDYIHEEENKIILGRFANTTEISNVILFLTSDMASYVNGSVIVCDGGVK